LPIDANSITALRQKNKAKRNLDIIVIAFGPPT
jgi:hypothetical protein